MRARTLAAAVLCGFLAALSGLAWSFAQREERAQDALDRLNVSRVALDYKIDRAKAKEEAIRHMLQEGGP